MARYGMKLSIVAAIALAPSTVQAGTIYVDAANCPGPGSGTIGDPYCTIQVGITAAVTGVDEVEVAPGTYDEVINFLGKAIMVRSAGGPDLTTIDGGGTFHVVRCVNGEGSATVLDGFTITGGNANGAGHPYNAGGGMYIAGGSSPTVRGCVFTANAATDIGGGLFVSTDSSVSVTGCEFNGNAANGGGAA
ncbi:MAG: hypothetical protein ACYTGG_11520, partial [Planctomycetota bacterium]